MRISHLTFNQRPTRATTPSSDLSQRFLFQNSFQKENWFTLWCCKLQWLLVYPLPKIHHVSIFFALSQTYRSKFTAKYSSYIKVNDAIMIPCLIYNLRICWTLSVVRKVARERFLKGMRSIEHFCFNGADDCTSRLTGITRVNIRISL